MPAVTARPARMPRIGVRAKTARKSATSGMSRSFDAASPMSVSPRNSIPNPASTPPRSCRKRLRQKQCRRTPARSRTGAASETCRAISCAVMVVPMFAPKITPAAWCRSMSPARTKPTTMTVVAEEDCTTMVKTRPTSSPRKRLRVRISRKRRRLSPAARSSPSPICFIPKRKSPSPPPSSARSCHVIGNPPFRQGDQNSVRCPSAERPGKPFCRSAS